MIGMRRDNQSRNDRERRQRRSRMSDPDSSPNDHSHSDRYEKRDNLSPLRSPLREDRMHHNKSPQYGCENMKHRQHDLKDLREKINRGSRRREQFSDFDKSNGNGQNLNGRRGKRDQENRGPNGRRGKPQDRLGERVPLLGKDDFPPLTTKDMNREAEDQVPELVATCWKKDTSLTKPADWSDQVEQFEIQSEQAERDLSKFRRKLTLSECSDGSEKSGKPVEFEDDPSILIRRQKQIDFGKNTIGYDAYAKVLPRHLRQKTHPRTPDKFTKVSRRSFDAQVRIWRKKLHFFDPKGDAAAADAQSDVVFNDNSSTASAPHDDSSSGCVSQETESWEEVKVYMGERVAAGAVSDNDGSDISDDLMNLALTEEIKSVPMPENTTSKGSDKNGFFSGFDLDAELDEGFVI